MPTEPLLACSETLIRMYSAERKLFSFSSTLEDGRIVNDFDNPTAIRYTVNSFLGLVKVPDKWRSGFDVEGEAHAFMESKFASVVNPGDKGLLLKLAAVAGLPSDAIREDVLRLAADKESLMRLPLQEVCWILLGLTASARHHGDEVALEAAGRVAQILEQEFFNRDTLFPFHAAGGPRRRFVSFGGISYFLMAMDAYARLTNDEYLAAITRESTRRVIALQGRFGEWAWFYDADRGSVVDWYEVYSVHQLSMAQLFLLGQSANGVDEASAAISKGTRWAHGENELGCRMVFSEPFFTHRSFRRKGPATRARRLAGAFVRAGTGLAAKPASVNALEVNPECRSYELGWLLYVWAPIWEVPGTEDLISLP